jgi:hypothetical protein
MRFIAPSELGVDGSMRQVCNACCSFVVGHKFCAACGHDVGVQQATVPAPRARLLASAFDSLGFSNKVSQRARDSFNIRADEIVVFGIDTTVKSSLKNLNLMICYPERPKSLSIGNGVDLESLVLTDRRIMGLLQKRPFIRSEMKKHGFQSRETKSGIVFERDSHLLTGTAWNTGNPAWFNFSLEDERTSDRESFQVLWRTGLSTGASLFLTAALMSRSHTQADAGGNVYIASKLGQMYNKPVPTNLRLLLEEVHLWSVVREYGAPEDLLAV